MDDAGLEPHAAGVPSVGGMRIIVHDTSTATRKLLDAPLANRPARLEAMLAPVLPMYQYAPSGPIESHHLGNGFRVDVERGELYRPALDRLARADAWGQVERCLTEAYAYQLTATPDLRAPEELHVVLLLGDPTDPFFVKVTGGYFGIGGFSGFLTLTVWPTDANEHKVGYCAAHELHHNLRFTNVAWNPATVTVGDQVVSEGLAEVFVRELYGVAAMGPWGDPAREDEDAYRMVLDHLDVAGMANLSAYVHGDETTRRMGGTPVGLPTGIGYVAGVRLVDAHIAATGLTAAQSTLLPAADIIRNARTGSRG
jgi:uncharacterized protein YjaZ